MDFTMTNNNSIINKSTKYRPYKIGDRYFIALNPDLAVKSAGEVFTEEATPEGILLRRQGRKEEFQ
jgi:hypothetical protein